MVRAGASYRREGKAEEKQRVTARLGETFNYMSSELCSLMSFCVNTVIERSGETWRGERGENTSLAQNGLLAEQGGCWRKLYLPIKRLLLHRAGSCCC